MRWSTTGPLTSAILGGGGGRDGFMKMAKTIGVASEVWTQDMKAHEFLATDENLEKVNESVQQMLDRVDLAKIEEQRDEVIMALTKFKSGK